MPSFIFQETDHFLNDIEVAAVWILESNLEQSEEFALRKVDDFENGIEELKMRLKEFP